MAAPEANIVTVDLRTQVPVGWTLTGLSEPKFDGVNFYRAVIDTQSTLTWHSDRSEFIQIDYQTYSDVERINTLLLVDGHRVSERKFAAGRFEIPESTGFFVPPGRHTLAIRYTCSKMLARHQLDSTGHPCAFMRTVKPLGSNRLGSMPSVGPLMLLIVPLLSKV